MIIEGTEDVIAGKSGTVEILMLVENIHHVLALHKDFRLLMPGLCIGLGLSSLKDSFLEECISARRCHIQSIRVVFNWANRGLIADKILKVKVL